jgi:hypothetical protein
LSQRQRLLVAVSAAQRQEFPIADLHERVPGDAEGFDPLDVLVVTEAGLASHQLVDETVGLPLELGDLRLVAVLFRARVGQSVQQRGRADEPDVGGDVADE